MTRAFFDSADGNIAKRSLDCWIPGEGGRNGIPINEGEKARRSRRDVSG